MANLQVRSGSAVSLNRSEVEQLDDSSLQTVLAMLEVMDAAEDLALLETLTPPQKRQVWEATLPATRARLKQLRTTAQLSPSLKQSHSTGLVSGSELRSELRSELKSELSLSDEQLAQAEETAAIDLEAQRQEVDLMLQEPLNLTAQPTLLIGDWVVLHASPKLSKAEMQTIWEVIELQGNYARIVTKGLGSRLYPTVAMTLYPRPVELPAEPELEDLEPF